MKINKKRIEKNIEKLASYTSTPDEGITRSSWSKEEMEAKGYLIEEMKKAGLKVYVDGVGAVFGRREGIDPKLPVVMVGSHYDSVVNGGKYDGAVGTIAALEAMRILNENGFENKYPIEMIAMNAEEGETFGPSTGVTNSRAIVGTLTEVELDTVKNRFGQTKKEAMQTVGITPDLKSSVWEEGSIKNFIELHIEQGPVLEENNKDIGIVEYLPGIGRYKVRFIGAKGDSTQKIKERKDALLAASAFTLEINELLKSMGEGITGGVHQMNISPNSNQFVPDYVECKVEIRTFDKKVLENINISDILTRKVKHLQNQYNINIEVEEMRRIGYENPTPPSIMDLETTVILKNICEDLNYSYQILNNGTGHDAMIMTDFTKTNLIYVPSHKGYTHQPEEYTKLDDIARGTQVVLELIKQLSI